jgi:hypoxanthine phosphoribosyltransferase
VKHIDEPLSCAHDALVRQHSFVTRAVDSSPWATSPKQRSKADALVTYDQIELFVESIRDELCAANFDGIACVLRGGAFVATCVAYATGVPLYFINYERATNKPNWLVQPPPGRILICEDYAGSGQTLKNVEDFVASSHPDYRILTAVKDSRSVCTPHWSMDFGDRRARLPWEREWTIRSQQKNEVHPRTTPDHELRFVGYDLDGVFCDDLPSEAYTRDLETCLRLRDTLPAADARPSLASRAAIITARPLEDAERTRTWLERNVPDARDTPVVHRNPVTFAADAAGSAMYKVAAAAALGCTDFVESCARQSLLMAQAAPWLRVKWWNNGEAVVVSALRVEYDRESRSLNHT